MDWKEDLMSNIYVFPRGMQRAGYNKGNTVNWTSKYGSVIAAGYDEALVYDRKPKTLSELEKLMGKAEFAEKIGGYVTKPLGKPTLAPASDKREAYSPAAADFAGVGADA